MTSSQTPSGISYDRAGPAGRAPVVLLHAGIADRRMWHPQWPALIKDRDTIRLDLRGFGSSTTRPERLDHVADVLATLEHLGVDSCHLVAASLGAGVAVEVALVRPDLVRSLVLAPPGGSLIPEATPALRAFFDAEREALARDDLDAAVEANVTAWVVGTGRDPIDIAPEVTASVRVMQRTAFEVTEGWDDLDEVELDPPALERLGEVDQPVLLIVGAHDLDTIHLTADLLERHLSDVRRVDLSGCAHLPSMEQPDEVLRLLLDWFGAR